MKLFPVLLLLLTLVTISSGLAGTPGAIDQSAIELFESEFSSGNDHAAVLNAIANNKLSDLALNRQKLIDHNTFVNLKVETAGITNQRSSGRCWMFAALNVFAPNVIKKLDLDDFEFSQPYLTFWDKMEKANLFLEKILAFRDLPVDDRKVAQTLENPFGDGGWYTYFAALVEKYGLAPYSAMPETKQSVATGAVNKLASKKLRVFAAELRELHAQGKRIDELRQRKEEMLAEIYRLMALCYGEPPKEFEFRYEPKDDSIKAEVKTYTPKSFAEEFVGDKIPEFVPLVNNPNWEYNLPYRGEWNRAMYEADDYTLLNLPVERLKYYAEKMLLDSQLVWFACDVGKEHSSDSALLMPGLYQYNELFSLDFSDTKAIRLQYGDSWATHAMALAGVDTTDSGETSKWLVENSWGTKKGDDGFWYMYDDWFDEYVYVLVVDKRLMEKEDLDNYSKEPRKTKMWDVFMNSLRNLQ